MIDIHTHLHPPRLSRAIKKWFAENSPWQLTHPTEPQAVAAVLKAAGVKRFVFCSYAHKPGIAKELNQWLLKTSKELDHFGLPLATVHPQDEDYVSYYGEALEGGCIGIKIHEDVQNLKLDDPAFDPIHALTLTHRAIVLVHVGPIPWNDNTDDGPSRVKKVLDKFPGLSIVVAHMGAPDSERYLALTSTYPNLYLDTAMALNAQTPMRRNYKDELLLKYTSNLLYGSDYPTTPNSYSDEVAAVTEIFKAVPAKAAVFEKNASKLLSAAGVSKLER